MYSDLIKIKSELLCKGVKIDSNLFNEFICEILYQKKTNFGKRTGLAGVQLLIGDRYIARLPNYLEYIKAIRQEFSVPILLELALPNTNNYLDKLADAGCNSLVINIEIWDNHKRLEICPGKFQISKQRYFETWKCVLGLFVENQVASVLVAGLETKESTLEVAKQLIQIGVIPIIMPFRPIDGCALEKHLTTSSTDILDIYRHVAILPKENGLNLRLQHGYTDCGVCSIEVDIKMRGTVK